jgi:nucleotide-binding universal stress UspA family protein
VSNDTRKKKELLMANNQRILAAVDGSQASHRAVAYVADIMAGHPGAHVGLLHLELPPRMVEWGGSKNPRVEDEVSERRERDHRKMQKDAIEDGQALLKRLRSLLAEKAIDVIAQVVRFQEPLDSRHIARETLKMARERGYGTIVVARQSFAGLRRLFAHDVAEELVRRGEGVSVWVVE